MIGQSIFKVSRNRLGCKESGIYDVGQPVGIGKIDEKLWLKSFDPEKHPEK